MLGVYSHITSHLLTPACIRAIPPASTQVHSNKHQLTVACICGGASAKHSGAFVAGMDAGRAYNTFPLMNGQLVPDEYRTLPGWRNAFESTAAVQLHHRALALSTLAAVGALWVGGRRLAPAGRIQGLLDATAAMTALQVGVFIVS